MIRRLLLGSVLLLLAAGGGWLGWRWYTTPVPPEIPLRGVEQDMAEAIEEALQEVRRQPRAGNTWGKLAMVLAANGFYEQAIGCLVHAERFDPTNPRWPYLRGVLLLRDRPQQGIAVLGSALALTMLPESQSAIRFRLALALVEDGQLDEADQHLEALRRIEGDSPRVHLGLGLLAIAREDRAAARDHLDPLMDNPHARKQACTLLATLTDGNKELARSYQRRAAGLPADLPWPNPFEDHMQPYKVDRMRRLEPFWELEKQGKHDDALVFLRKFVAESPDAESCYTLGYTLYKRQAFREAEEALRQAIGINPLNAKSHLFLGAALFGRGEKLFREAGAREQALELFRQAVSAEDRALALQSDLGYAHFTRGRALRYLGGMDAAVRALRQAVLCHPDAGDMHLALGEALAEAGQVKEALEHLKNAVRLAKPGDARARLALEKWQALAVPGSNKD